MVRSTWGGRVGGNGAGGQAELGQGVRSNWDGGARSYAPFLQSACPRGLSLLLGWEADLPIPCC